MWIVSWLFNLNNSSPLSNIFIFGQLLLISCYNYYTSKEEELFINITEASYILHDIVHKPMLFRKKIRAEVNEACPPHARLTQGRKN